MLPAARDPSIQTEAISILKQRAVWKKSWCSIRHCEKVFFSVDRSSPVLSQQRSSL